jgi:4-hydroxybutyrate CoA-transferase
MHKWKELYKEKMLTAEEIAEFIGSNTVCVCPIAAGEPVAIPRAIAQRAIKDNLVGIVQYSLLSIVNNDLWNNTDLDGKFNHTTLYCGTNGVREAIFAKRADFIPSFYSQIPRVVNEYIKPDVFYATVSPMDEHGYFSFGTSISNSMMMKKVAKKVYLEVNDHMPKTHGNSFIHITEVDGLCEMNRELPELKSSPLSETEMTIGNYIAELVPDGAVIQLGIGGIPNAAALALRGKRDLGIHSELFTESMVDLIDQGVVTNKKKNIHEGKSVATFAFGTKRMYDYLNDTVQL